MKKISICILTLLLGSCAISSQAPAPIVNGSTKKSTTSTTMVSTQPVVKKSVADTTNDVTQSTQGSDTKISKMNDDDEIPSTPIKQSVAPVVIESKVVASTKPITNNVKPSSASSVVIDGVSWIVPTQGSIIKSYSVASKGVDVSASEGQEIVAANDGTVAYSGSGLKGYGNLIIIKHADNYLTAYSHNKVNLVKDGASVKRGQKIAEVGSTAATRPMLHFELRKNGKPIDPTAIFQNGAN